MEQKIYGMECESCSDKEEVKYLENQVKYLQDQIETLDEKICHKQKGFIISFIL
jgi:peptidoglycan hydrolase CwlO-like protein